MLPYSCLFTIVLLINGLSNARSLTPCKSDDQACVENNANAVYQEIMNGVPALNLEPLEPIHHALIEGDLSILKYKFFDSTFTGLNKCKITNLRRVVYTVYSFDSIIILYPSTAEHRPPSMNTKKIDPFNSIEFIKIWWIIKDSKVNFDFICPPIEMRGRYEIDGRLIILPIEGKGDYQMHTGGYKLEIDCEVDIVQGHDGKKHAHIKTYKLKPTATGPIVFDFRNLFNGKKDLSDTIHKFANENWKEVSDFVQDPVWYEQGRRVITNVNKYLKSKSIDEMLIQ